MTRQFRASKSMFPHAPLPSERLAVSLGSTQSNNSLLLVLSAQKGSVYAQPLQRFATHPGQCLCHCPDLLGDALAEKIAEMHESGAVGAETEVDPMSSIGGAGGAAVGSEIGPSGTPMEYVSFLKGWFDMHESKKVLRRALFRP